MFHPSASISIGHGFFIKLSDGRRHGVAFTYNWQASSRIKIMPFLAESKISISDLMSIRDGAAVCDAIVAAATFVIGIKARLEAQCIWRPCCFMMGIIKFHSDISIYSRRADAHCFADAFESALLVFMSFMPMMVEVKYLMQAPRSSMCLPSSRRRHHA